MTREKRRAGGSVSELRGWRSCGEVFFKKATAPDRAVVYLQGFRSEGVFGLDPKGSGHALRLSRKTETAVGIEREHEILLVGQVLAPQRNFHSVRQLHRQSTANQPVAFQGQIA